MDFPKIVIWTGLSWIAFCLVASPLPYGSPEFSIGYDSYFWKFPEIVRNLLLVVVWPTFPTTYLGLFFTEMADSAARELPIAQRRFIYESIFFFTGLILNFVGWLLLLALARSISSNLKKKKQAQQDAAANP